MSTDTEITALALPQFSLIITYLYEIIYHYSSTRPGKHANHTHNISALLTIKSSWKVPFRHIHAQRSAKSLEELRRQRTIPQHFANRLKDHFTA